MKGLLKALGNPIVQTVLGLVAGVALIKWLLGPGLEKARKAYSDTVDEVGRNVASIMGGAPTSQDLSKRSAGDAIVGIAVAGDGDRALSDAVDTVKKINSYNPFNPFNWFK